MYVYRVEYDFEFLDFGELTTASGSDNVVAKNLEEALNKARTSTSKSISNIVPKSASIICHVDIP